MIGRATLYEASINKFKDDVVHNRMADTLSQNFRTLFGYTVQDGEFNSWQNSLQYLKNILDLAKLQDNMIALEYNVPYSNRSRIDCLLFGKSVFQKSYVVLIELKQWSKITPIDNEDNFIEGEDADYYVETNINKGPKRLLHPSQQVKGYHDHLINFVEVFEVDSNMELFSCSYCHNYSNRFESGLYSDVFKPILQKFPLYSKEDAVKLSEKLYELLSNGDGLEIFNRFFQSPIRPSKKLFEHLSDVIDNKPVFSLINDQIISKNIIISKIKNFKKNGKKNVIIIEGGPGTGKTLIALNIIAEVAKNTKKLIFFATKSKPLLEALRTKIGYPSKLLFSNLNAFLPSKVKTDSIDLLLVDEAHRIAKTSNFQFTPLKDKTDIPQIEQLILCAKTSVFFIDDKQRIRSAEVGSIDLIRSTALKFNANLEEVVLTSQFRCNGSDNYLDWLEASWGYNNNKKILTEKDNYEFKIFTSPNELHEAILEKEKEKLNSARLVAGFCWPWSKKLDDDGNIVKDIKIGDFEMPWETHGEINKPPKGYVKWYEWAYKPEGIKQVGCIYTAQGFEFNYIGVIVGDDVRFDKSEDRLVGNISGTYDATLKKKKELFDSHVKNIYRVLMSRGIKGCYVYFCNKEVEQYFRDRINFCEEDKRFSSSKIISIKKEIDIVSDISDKLKYKDYLPVYNLEAVATNFGEKQNIEQQGWLKINHTKLNSDWFVARVKGKSMEPTIPDGAWCVFTKHKGGTNQNKILVVNNSEIFDDDNQGCFTIKRYFSEKEFFEDGTWIHKQIVLKPDNKNFNDIILENIEAKEFYIIAEFLFVID